MTSLHRALSLAIPCAAAVGAVGCCPLEFHPVRLSPEWQLNLLLWGVFAYGAWGVGNMMGTTAMDVIRGRAQDRMVDDQAQTLESAEDGALVRVAGVVEAIAPLVVAPVSERRVVGYRVQADCWQSVKFKKDWYPEIDATKVASFELVVGADRVRIVGPTFCVDGGSLVQESAAATPTLRRTLWRYLSWHRRWWGPLYRYRWHEARIEPGAEVEVVGVLSRSARKGAGAYRDGRECSIDVVGTRCRPVAVRRASRAT